MCCAPVHMQLCSQGQVLSLSSALEDARSLPTGGACHCGAHAKCWGPKLSSPSPIDLALRLLNQPTAQFHAFLSEHLCTVCPRGHGRWSPEACKLSSWQASPSFPPPQNAKGRHRTPLMNYGRDCSQPTSKGIWRGG